MSSATAILDRRRRGSAAYSCGMEKTAVDRMLYGNRQSDTRVPTTYRNVRDDSSNSRQTRLVKPVKFISNNIVLVSPLSPGSIGISAAKILKFEHISATFLFIPQFDDKTLDLLKCVCARRFQFSIINELHGQLLYACIGSPFFQVVLIIWRSIHRKFSFFQIISETEIRSPWGYTRLAA